MIKLFASDMDGTLLNPQHQLNTFTAQAIKQLQKNGIEFMISTGRDYQSASRLLAPYDIKCSMVNLNGALIYNENGNVIFRRSIENATFTQIINTLTHDDLVYSIFTANDYYLSNKEYYLNQLIKTLNKKSKVDALTVAQVADRINDTSNVQNYHYSEEDPALKMMIISNDPQILQLYRQKFDQFPDLDITSSGENNIEITHIHAQKGLALQKYAISKGYTTDEVLTIGDSLNDRSMLQLFPNSYAMDNASKDIKNIASYRAPSNAENGVAHVIERILNQ